MKPSLQCLAHSNYWIMFVTSCSLDKLSSADTATRVYESARFIIKLEGSWGTQKVVFVRRRERIYRRDRGEITEKENVISFKWESGASQRRQETRGGEGWGVGRSRWHGVGWWSCSSPAPEPHYFWCPEGLVYLWFPSWGFWYYWERPVWLSVSIFLLLFSQKHFMLSKSA